MNKKFIIGFAVKFLPFLLVGFPTYAADFAEVALTIGYRSSVIHPVAVVELGKTADIQFSMASGSQKNSSIHTDRDGSAGRNGSVDHRILLTVTQERGSTYRAKAEYMTRSGSKWVSQWQPALYLQEGTDGRMELTSGRGETLQVSMTVIPRPEVSSFADLRSSYYHTTGGMCSFESVESLDTDSPNTKSIEEGSATGNNTRHVADEECCGKICQGDEYMLQCCNSCCSDRVLCPNDSCCAGNHPHPHPEPPGPLPEPDPPEEHPPVPQPGIGT